MSQKRTPRAVQKFYEQMEAYRQEKFDQEMERREIEADMVVEKDRDLTKLTPIQNTFLDVLKFSCFSITTACRRVNISRKTFYNWKESNEYFAKCVENSRLELIELAESQLYDFVKLGHLPAIFFVLKTKGKRYGWGETRPERIKEKIIIERRFTDSDTQIQDIAKLERVREYEKENDIII